MNFAPSPTESEANDCQEKNTTEFAQRDCQVVQLVRTNLQLIGKGKEGSPFRRLIQYWTFEGLLLFQHDPCPDEARDDEVTASKKEIAELLREAELKGLRLAHKIHICNYRGCAAAARIAVLEREREETK